MSSTKNKHLTLSERQEIEDCLRHNMSFKQIGKELGKDPTTISKEVKRNFIVFEAKNPLTEPCKNLIKAPYVCNGCSYRRSCTVEKHVYSAKAADNKYRETLADSRTGVALNRESFYRADELLYDGVKNKGQHIFHITQTHDLGMSTSTVYRNINKGYLSVGRMDLPRAVKFKPRRAKDYNEYVPNKLKAGRTYDDFLAFIEENEIANWVEMDTVIGRRGGKVIMTFDFTFCNFMFGLLLDNKSAAEASQGIIGLKKRLAANGERFSSVIPLLLTDNGSEFTNIHAFINDLNGVPETDLFFCHPYKSCEKPRVEKNHTLFRDICPQGTSFDGFTQEDVDFIFSHVNGIKRKKLLNKTPYEMFAFTYGVKIASLLGIRLIPPEDVCQSPSLLKQLPSLTRK